MEGLPYHPYHSSRLFRSCFPLENDLRMVGFHFFSSMVIHTFICGTPMTRLTPISGAPRNHAGDIPTFHLE